MGDNLGLRLTVRVLQLWPGAVNFPDFISAEGQQWWKNQLTVSPSLAEMKQCLDGSVYLCACTR